MLTLTPALIDALLTHLKAQLPTLLGVYAFGSRVQAELADTVRADSDLDLAVLVEGYADPVQLWHLSAELADKAGCDVDLLDLRAASSVMQQQVLLTGQTWWEKRVDGSNPAALWAAAALTEKLHFDALRAPQR